MCWLASLNLALLYHVRLGASASQVGTSNGVAQALALVARVQRELLAKQAEEASSATASKCPLSDTATKLPLSASALKDLTKLPSSASATKDPTKLPSSASATKDPTKLPSSASALKDPTKLPSSASATKDPSAPSATHATKVLAANPERPAALKPETLVAHAPEVMLQTDPDSDEEERRELAADLVPPAFFAGEESAEEEDEMWDDEVMEEWFKFKGWTEFPYYDWSSMESWQAWSWGGENSKPLGWHEENGDWQNEADDSEDKGKEALASRPIATPVRAASAAAKPDPLRRLPSSSSLQAPPSEATTLPMPGAVVDVPDASSAAAMAGDDLRINSTTHKREYMRLVDASAIY